MEEKQEKGIFSIFKEKTQNFAKGLLEISSIEGDNIFDKIRNKINKDKNREVREKIENDEWEVKEIEKSSIDGGNEKIANKILDLISKEQIDLKELKKISCMGLPPILRSSVWKILLGITPLDSKDHDKKRQQLTEEYKGLLLKHYRDSQEDEQLHHQIRIDCVRTSIHGFLHVFENQSILEILNRILYLWSREYPSVNYFQGLNEILAPIIFFYLCEYVDINSSQDLLSLSSQDLANLEIDSYFSLKQILDWIMDSYDSSDGSAYAGPMILEISRSVKLNLPALDLHIKKLNLDYNVLCFRWALCLLCREMNILNVGRLFDNYFSMGQTFPKLHPYVCVSILEMFCDKILPLEFSETILVLQRLVPATFSQTRDIDQINPLIKRAIKIQEKDSKHVPSVSINPNESPNKVSSKQSEREKQIQKENDNTTSILVGGVILSLFATAVAYHLGKKYTRNDK